MRREAIVFLSLVIALVLSGVYVVYSASIYGNRLERQLIYVGIGLVALTVTSHFNYRRWADAWVYRGIALLGLLLLVAVLIPQIGDERLGAQRWIQIAGFSFQPSEPAKFALILVLAVKLARNGDALVSFVRGLLPPLAIMGVFAVLVYMQNDLGTPVVMGATAFFMLFLAGARWRHLLPLAAIGAGGVYMLILAKAHRLSRLTTFLDPWADPRGTGYQLIQSISAFNQGAIWGRGPGAGEQKLGFLPEADNDFIFAVWGEELGLVGCLALVSMFAALLILGMRIAWCARDRFGMLLAGGIVSMLAFQSAFNMAVTVGLLPTKGLTLPFISWGGTSLIVYMAMMGVVINVALYAEAPQRNPVRAVAASAA